jgi:MarR family transcriptional regulator, organic hydroperoxide resistance regulator
MSPAQSREAARELLQIMPLVMRAVAAELRSGGEMPAPAHFGLLMKLREQPRTLSELASHWGVSLPTTSNSITALAQRGWVRRSSPASDRRVAIVEITASGRAVLERVGRVAEARLADVLLPLDRTAQRRLHAGLAVLRDVFAAPPAAPRRKGSRARD